MPSAASACVIAQAIERWFATPSTIARLPASPRSTGHLRVRSTRIVRALVGRPCLLGRVEERQAAAVPGPQVDLATAARGRADAAVVPAGRAPCDAYQPALDHAVEHLAHEGAHRDLFVQLARLPDADAGARRELVIVDLLERGRGRASGHFGPDQPAEQPVRDLRDAQPAAAATDPGARLHLERDPVREQTVSQALLSGDAV